MTRSEEIKNAIYALMFSALGALFKVYGGMRYSSEAVFVDGLTCIAGLFAGLSVIWWLRKASMPPDEDHPYGHERLLFGGVVHTIVIYSLVAGYIFFMLLHPKSYEVSPEASIYAAIGVAFYAIAIALYRRVTVAGSPIAIFTFSEILEGVISITSSLLGSMWGYMIDYIGAWIIEAYLFVEIGQQSIELINMISDRVSPKVKKYVENEFRKRGFSIVNFRLRCVVPGKYQGDISIVPENDMSDDRAYEIAKEIQERLLESNIDLIVHVKRKNKYEGK